MVVRQETRPAPGAQSEPAEFREAVATMHAVALRPEIFCESMPAPQRIAPYASALSADLTVDDVDLGTGRLILLHDPDGNDAWQGTFRCVAYARADIDHEMAVDESFAGAAWSWLSDALDEHGATYSAISGTITRVTSESFGAMDDEEPTAQVEVRASWTPLGVDDAAPDLGPHVKAWTQVLCSAAGLPPVPDGVAILPSRRGQRG